MNRRGFLKLLGGAAPAIIRPTYFFAPPGGWPFMGEAAWANNSYGQNLEWRRLTAQDIMLDFEKHIQKALYGLMDRTPRIPYTEAGAALILEAVNTAVDSNPHFPKIYTLEISHSDYARKFLLGDWNLSEKVDDANNG